MTASYLIGQLYNTRKEHSIFIKILEAYQRLDHKALGGLLYDFIYYEVTQHSNLANTINKIASRFETLFNQLSEITKTIFD